MSEGDTAAKPSGKGGSPAKGDSKTGAKKANGSSESKTKYDTSRSNIVPYEGGKGEEHTSEYQPSGDASNIVPFPGSYQGQDKSKYAANPPGYKGTKPGHKKTPPSKKKKEKKWAKVARLSDKKEDGRNLEQRLVEEEFESWEKEYKPEREKAPYATKKEKVKGFVRNIKNVSLNAIDNTIGYALAKVQNARTRKYLQENPFGKEKIVYLLHGLYQNEGSQWRLAKELEKKGYLVYHLQGNHHLPAKERNDRIFDQIESLYMHPDSLRGKGTKKMQIASYREGIFSGHSSGADAAILLSQDERVRQYRINKIQARAPVIMGMGTGYRPTLGQRLMAPLLRYGDTADTFQGRKNVVEMHKKRPLVPVDVISGKYDDLVPPRDAVYKYARSHVVIDHPDSTHFGTSGGNKLMNDYFAEHLSKDHSPKRKYHEHKKAA